MPYDKDSQLFDTFDTIRDLMDLPIPLPQREKEEIIMHALNLNQMSLFQRQDVGIIDSHKELLKNLFQKRISGIPLAYVIGVRGFYGLDFMVNHDVLIPRPETELFVDLVWEIIRHDKSTAYSIVDIGTGSGNIIITLATQTNPANNSCRFYGVDISEKALRVAIINAKKHAVLDQITFYESDLLENIPLNDILSDHNTPLILTANLPYVDINRRTFLEGQSYGSELKHEPDIALWASDYGLCVYKKLLLQIDRIRTNGYQSNAIYCFFEIDPCQRVLLKKFLEKHTKAENITFTKDLSGLDRVCHFTI